MLGGNLEVLGTGGDPELGGGNFDDRIVDWMMEYLEKIPGYAATLTDNKRIALRMKLKTFAEDAKKALCGPPPRQEYQFQIPLVDKLDGKPIPFRETLSMEKFNELISDLMKNSLKWIDVAMKVPKEKHYTEEHITAILLVGGSTRVPLVYKILEDRFPKTSIRGVESGIHPDEIVAMGASIIAAEEEIETDTDLVDVTGHTLSVNYLDIEQGKELLKPIIPKETKIPIRGSHQFASLGNFQEHVMIKVYQGESEEIDPDKVTMIGEFIMEIDPIKEPIPIIIGLDLDENGILTAKAVNAVNNKQVKCQINYTDSTKMSPEELKRKQAELERQMQTGVGRTVNPLDEQSQPASATSNRGGDVREMLNPILRNLYDKAMNSFDKIPADRQAKVAEMIAEIENTAKSGDQAKLMTFIAPLSKLLEGI
jgi:molecular chaperone DnaK